MNMGRSVAVRSIFLGCLRENATNMRQEHEDLGRRIAISLANSRKTLANIESMNIELQKMKETIHNAINNIRRDANYENKSCRLLVNILFIVVEEFGLDANLNPENVSRMFLEVDPTTDKPGLPALENTKQDSKGDDLAKSDYNEISYIEPLAGPKPSDDPENSLV
ncbi:uncharacterized protein [Drosophila takahashii]|uniref:uncharacterized protein n=1 Tax=Drosophila takahashii TaxID=29030 RepID=UPI001CF83BFF|nr:uncharacterized protein LOC108055579 [Drosophila takahashii]